MRLTTEELKELLVEARVRYPKGCSYSCVRDGQTGILDSDLYLHGDNDGDIYGHFSDKAKNGIFQYVYIHKTGTWAPVISYPKDYIKPGEVINEYEIF